MVQIGTGSVIFVYIYRVRYVKEQTAKKKVKCYLGLADYFFFQVFFGLDLTGCHVSSHNYNNNGIFYVEMSMSMDVSCSVQITGNVCTHVVL